MRPWLLALLAILLMTAACADSDTRSVGSRRTADALALLREWDRQRARAWTDGDTASLAALYTRGSLSGRHDLAMLEAYQARGLRVAGLRTQVLSATLRSWTPGRVVLEVTDRVVGAHAVGRGSQIDLPSDRPSTRVVTLRREAGAWLVGEVRDAGSSP